MNEIGNVSYGDSGVDKTEGYRAVGKMKNSVAATQGPEVLGGLGSFAGLYAMEGWKNPVLVSGTDGVGTKLRPALDAGKLDVIGRDCYAMVANDILCHGAQPLFFLDYVACGKLDADTAAGIVEGMAAACLEDGCALIGGETAEMPGFYAPGDYDVAGFAVGAVELSRLVDGSSVEEGDAIVGLASDGVHSNGFSLIRALFPDSAELPEGILRPTRLYGNPVRALLADGIPIRGMAHITGGGLPENLPRAIGGDGLRPVVERDSWTVPDIFKSIGERGVAPEEMDGTFNMGIGFALIVPGSEADGVLTALKAAGENAFRIGTVRKGEGGLCYV